MWDWTVPWSEMLDRKRYFADVITKRIEDATPGGGAYLNDADPYVYGENTKKWQETFYGEHYQKLREIKHKWDSHATFYAHTALGSEDWKLDGDGRL